MEKRKTLYRDLRITLDRLERLQECKREKRTTEIIEEIDETNDEIERLLEEIQNL